MTISSTTNRVSYAGDDGTTAFSFPHRFLAREDLTVILVVDATGVETTQTLTTDYTVTGTGDANGGTVNMVTAPATGETLVIINDPDLTQETDLADGSALPAESVESVFDRLTIIAQRVKTLVERSLRLPDGDTSGASLELPPPTALNMIRWDAAGTALENFEDVETSGVTLSDNEIAAKVGTAVADGLPVPQNSVVGRFGASLATLAVPQNSVVGRFGASLATLAVSASRIVGRGASGALKAMTSSEVFSFLGITATAAELNSVLTPYAAQRVELGGDFNAGQEVVCERIGNMVTITSGQVGGLNHSSSDNPTSSAGVIPAAFRPSYSVNNQSFRDNVPVSTVINVTSAGTFSLDYYGDATDTPAQTNVTGVSITYLIADNI